MSQRTFHFDLGAEVSLNRSLERGSVIGRAEYTNADNSYFVRYVDSTGSQVESWIAEDALIATN